MLKIQQCVKTKVSNTNLVITENQLKRFGGKITGDDAKRQKD